MVNIYTNENNPASLKILIAKNFAKKSVELKIVNVNDNISQPKHLPYIEIDQHVLFSVNNAICYFLPTTDDNFIDVTNLLEWEATNLSPQLAQVFGGSSRNENIKAALLSNLKFLNDYLQNKCFLVGNDLTAADISIWSIIYPLSINSKLAKEYLNNLTNITNWVSQLETKDEFKNALGAYKIDSSTSYNALLIGAKYLSISEDNQKGSAQQEKEVIEEAVTIEELNYVKECWYKDISKQQQLKKTKAPVLPNPGEKNVLITSALPYVNNIPHLGNIIGCVLSADVFARFSRLCNNNTLYICGTDEYGTATETKALEEGLTCQQICDKYHKIHKEIYEWFNISFDHFGRTSTPHQTEICQEMFLTLNHNGFMFTEIIEQLHCEKCNKFLADRFVEGGCPHPGCNYEDARGDQCDGCGKLVNAIELKNPRCKVCRSTPQKKTSKQFFIDLPKLEPLVHHWVKLKSPGWSNNSQVITKAWLKEGLKPRCITRDLKWGVPVPIDGFRDKVFYVWFDAPLGYLSITKAYTKDYEKWWKPDKESEVILYQFMAKDNVPFHSVLFPSMLLGTNKGYVTVNHLMATEYLNYEDDKFSKSRGVGVFGTDARNTGIPSDIWRFYLLYVRPESQDSSFSWDDFATKNNSELLNNLGNFINRALVFAKNNFNGTIPEMNPTEEDYTLLALCTRELKGYLEALEKVKLKDGIKHILAISRHGNQYMQVNQPWVLLKGTNEQKLRAGTVIGMCCNLACLISTLLQPYMPDTSETLKKQLNAFDIVLTPKIPEIVTMLPSGHKLGEPSPLFAKIELATIEELKKKFAGKQNKKANASGDTLDIKALEIAVANQADKVRQLKSSGVAKADWQPEVAILLDLKKKLEAAQKSSTAASVQLVQGNPGDVKKLEEEVAKQADKVRQLKSSGVAKADWQPEVNILLELKKRLELAQKSTSLSIQSTQENPGEVKKLEEEVAKQGMVVRKLKEGGAEKSVWQPEVDKLLALKNKLAAATGTPVATSQKSKKSKK